jgi:hypothetical protein
LHAQQAECSLKQTAWNHHHTQQCAQQLVQQKSQETRESQQSTSKFVLQAVAVQELQDLALKQQSEPSQDSASALNALKK